MIRFDIPYKQSAQGFSLTELVVVVILIGVLAGISIANWSRSSSDERVKAAARGAAAWLDEARRIAIQRGNAQRVKIDRATSVFLLTDSKDSSQSTSLILRESVDGGGSLLICSANLSGADPATLSLPCTTTQSGSTELVFTPRGTSSTGLLLKFSLPESNTSRCVAVMAPLGQIRSGKATSTGCDFTTSF